MSDVVEEARRVLALSDDDDEQCYENELAEALRNLLTYIECLTAPVTGDRAELVLWHREQADMHRHTAVFKGVSFGERHETTAALLEADARREAALADEVLRLREALEKAGDDGRHDDLVYDLNSKLQEITPTALDPDEFDNGKIYVINEIRRALAGEQGDDHE